MGCTQRVETGLAVRVVGSVGVLCALLGLGTGVGAGMALKPTPGPESHADACASPPAAGTHGEAEAGAEPCAEDPFAP